jgi:hypothetical protein
MFYRHCWNCGNRWSIGAGSTCTCPDETTKSEWVGLTDEEIGEIAIKAQDGISPHDDTLRFARAIEAAVWEKQK